MEIEKTLQLHAAPEQVWALLLNPQEMAQCVPGMESVEVLSPDEYLAVMKVKISFISARFKLKTTIVERNAPLYLRAEGTGEDASVSSSLKQVSEMWLAPKEGGTELRMKVVVDVLGRLGAFGLGVMKTKADRLWDEFGVNVNARLAQGGVAPVAAASISADATAASTGPAQIAPADTSLAPVAAVQPGRAPHPAEVAAAAAAAAQAAPAASAASPAPAGTPVTAPLAQTRLNAGSGASLQRSWWQRLVGPSESIEIDFQRGDLRVRASWPASAAAECAAWLRTLN